MLVRGGIEVLQGLFDAVFRPEEFVSSEGALYSGSWSLAFSQGGYLVFVYLVNLILYAVPLTLTGVGFRLVPTPPGWFLAVADVVVGDPRSLWEFSWAVYRNSYFITGMVGVVLLTYHGAVVYARASRGFLQSFHTVVYTSTAYLAAIYTILTTLSTMDGVDRAAELATALQQLAFVNIVDIINRVLPTTVESPFGTPGEIPLSGFSELGSFLLMLLVLSGLYFLYTLYLGARINHQTSRLEGLIVVLGVVAAPIAYIAGSVLFSDLVLRFLIQ